MRLLALAVIAILSWAAASRRTSTKARSSGRRRAPVRIEIYSDFACPACKNFHEQTLPLILSEYVRPARCTS